MAIAKTSVSIISSGPLVPGSTKASPSATGSTINCSTYYGGELAWKITNGSTPPGAAAIITFQVSPDGTNWFDYYTVAGDTTASSINSGAIQLDRGVMNVRAIAYGNTTTSVTTEAHLQAVTAL